MILFLLKKIDINFEIWIIIIMLFIFKRKEIDYEPLIPFRSGMSNVNSNRNKYSNESETSRRNIIETKKTRRKFQ